jgi:hypothetical protein
MRLQGLRDLLAKLGHGDYESRTTCANEESSSSASVTLSFDNIFPRKPTTDCAYGNQWGEGCWFLYIAGPAGL